MIRRKFMSVVLCAVLLGGLLVPLNNVYANEQETTEYEATEYIVPITYDQALRMAMDGSLQLQDLNTEIRDAHIAVREEIWRMEREFFWSGSRSTIELTERAIDSALQRLYNRLRTGGYGSSRQNRERRQEVQELIRHMEILRIQRQQAELGIEIALRGAVVNLAGIEQSISTLQHQIAFMEVNAERLTLAHELGFISIHALRDATHELAQAQYNLDDLLRSQSRARQELNYLINQPSTQLTFVAVPGQVLSLADINTSAMITQDPFMRNAQMELDRALGARWVYTGNDRDIRITDAERRRALNTAGTANNSNYWYWDSSNSIANLINRIALQDNVERAMQGRDSAMRSLEAAVNRGLADIQDLLATVASLQRELASAQSALDVVVSNFDIGHAIQLDVDAANLAVFQIEQGIDSIHGQLWILSLLLTTPSMLMN